jgi:DNA uptake protein ComE-like DNA-binding protein
MTIKDGRGAGFRGGSVLILVVLLMVLLSVLGMLFLLMSRLDEMATWSISENRELKAGVEVIVHQINRVLVEDLFGNDANMLNADASDEYYDYPGAEDAWLGSLEPESFYDNDTPSYSKDDKCFWRWISDINGYGFNAGLGGTAAMMVTGDESVVLFGMADADGDGVEDSRWAAVPNISTSKGKTIYAAVRIVDNGGMVNVNTAMRDPTILATPGQWDGFMLSHVNLEWNINGEGIRAKNEPGTGADLQRKRYGSIDEASLLFGFNDYASDFWYEFHAARRILNPHTISVNEAYMPFDISDELELRNRFFLKSLAVTPIETVWQVTFDPGLGGVGVQIPYNPNNSNDKIYNWFDKVKPARDEPGWAPGDAEIGDYNRRHLSTVYNFDRVMVRKVDISEMPASLRLLDDPNGWSEWTQWDKPQPELWLYRPVCVNDYWAINNGPTLEQIAGALWLGLDGATVGFDDSPGGSGYGGWSVSRKDLACQLAVNLIDYIDTDPSNTSYNFGGTTKYYGFEETQQDVYISEIAVAKYDDGTSTVTYYAIGLYNPWTSDVDLSGWKLEIPHVPLTPIGFDTMSDSRIVPAGNVLVIVNSADAASNGFGAASVLSGFDHFANDEHITLLSPSGRPVDGIFTGTVSGIPPEPSSGNIEYHSIDRGHRLIGDKYPVWDTSATWASTGSATDIDDFTVDTGAGKIWKKHMQLATRDDGAIRTIGEIFNVLGIGASAGSGGYRTLPEWLGAYYNTAGDDLEAITAGRMDAADPNYAKALNYVTVFNPFSDGVDNDGNVNTGEDVELQIAGRININTAPWFVIAQLPWMQYMNVVSEYDRARAIVASRLADGPYESVTELMRVRAMQLAPDGLNNTDPGPDFTPDTAIDDLEERDVIFSRVSNLVTVRSDVFTAYILVRLGIDGPQRRMIGIFDRSRVFLPTDKPKVVALHPVPDPR